MSTEVRLEDRSGDAVRRIHRALEIALVESAVHAEDSCVQEISGHRMNGNKAVDTGRLMGSITWRTSVTHDAVRPPVKRNDEAGSADGLTGRSPRGTAEIGTNVSYASHVEYGTKRMAARPFLRHGMIAAIGGIRRIFARRLGEA